MRYHVMRADENGNQGIVGGEQKPACFCSPEGAEFERLQLEKGSRKQTHWVQPVLTCPHQEPALPRS